MGLLVVVHGVFVGLRRVDWLQVVLSHIVVGEVLSSDMGSGVLWVVLRSDETGILLLSTSTNHVLVDFLVVEGSVGVGVCVLGIPPIWVSLEGSFLTLVVGSIGVSIVALRAVVSRLVLVLDVRVVLLGEHIVVLIGLLDLLSLSTSVLVSWLRAHSFDLCGNVVLAVV